jgi:polysaccharide pyruvyl transferase CsaB
MRAADAVIVGGGGLLQDETSPFNLPYHLLRPIVGRVLRRPVGAIGLGAGPVDTRLGRGLVRHGLRGVAPVTVRDDESRQVLQRLGIAARTTADLAFGLPVPVAGPADRLVVCLRPWSPARRLMPVGSRRVDPTPPWFVPAAARALDSAADALGLPVHFVALQADRDHPLHEAIARTMRTPATLASPGVHDVVDEVARGAVVVSMRYHGIVAATLAGRPSVAVGYSPKVDALAHDIGRAARALPWSGEGIAAIPDALRAIAANGADALEARERLRARERGNDDAIDDLLRR